MSYISKFINDEKDKETKQLYKTIHYTALKFNKIFPTASVEDLFQEGFLGSVAARKKFKKTYKVPFLIFAQYEITNHIEKFIVSNYFEQTGSVFYRTLKIKQDLDKFNCIERIKKEFGISHKTLVNYLHRMHPTLPLEEDEVIDGSLGIEQYIEREFIFDIIKTILKNSQNDGGIDKINIFLAHFAGGLTFDEIADEYNESKQTIHKRYQGLMSDIRKEIRN